jgi:hypothetical protein
VAVVEIYVHILLRIRVLVHTNRTDDDAHVDRHSVGCRLEGNDYTRGTDENQILICIVK